MSSLTDARILLHGASHSDSTKLIRTLRADEVGVSTVVFDWVLPTCEWYVTIPKYQVDCTLPLTVISHHRHPF